MTHREIQKAATASADLFCEVTDCYDEYEVGRHAGYTQGFADGAEWRIESVWHKKEEVPEDGQFTLCLQIDGNPIILGKNYANWEKTISDFWIIGWAYIKDVVPEKLMEEDLKNYE